VSVFGDEPTSARSNKRRRSLWAAVALATAGTLALASCSTGSDESVQSGSTDSIVVYSGRSENLIGPLLADFTAQTGVNVEVRYGDSADLALLIAEEGERSPADVFISQSPGAVGFLAEKDRLGAIPAATLQRVASEFRNKDGQWVGMSGRVRVLVHNTDEVETKTLPESVFDLTGEEYRGKVALAPSNGSFQDFVTGMRQQHGDEATEKWLKGMAENDAKSYANNTAIVEAVGRGEVPMGLVNHYYNAQAKAENPSVPSENYFFPNKDIGSLLIVTALGILQTTKDAAKADQLLAFLLSDSAQEFFSSETSEYPLVEGVKEPTGVPPLASLDVDTIDMDTLGGGLGRTLQMIEASGLKSS
jgi:iron(III) transport system substrate-binding protein